MVLGLSYMTKHFIKKNSSFSTEAKVIISLLLVKKILRNFTFEKFNKKFYVSLKFFN